MVERDLAKVEVAGSSPVSRSIFVYAHISNIKLEGFPVLIKYAISCEIRQC